MIDISISTTPQHDLILVNPLPLDKHPAAVYLASLTSERSRRVTAQALRTVTAYLTGDDPRAADFLALNWSALRYAHTAALRSKLAQEYSPATMPDGKRRNESSFTKQGGSTTP